MRLIRFKKVSGSGQKKRRGPVAPAYGVGYSGLIASNADRRRDWHPGGGRDMWQFSVNR